MHDASTNLVIAGLLLTLAAGVYFLLWCIKILIRVLSGSPTLPEEEAPAFALSPSELQELGRQRLQMLLEKELARGVVTEPRVAVRGAKNQEL